MGMKDYKVTFESGESTYYQFDDSTDEGKAMLASLDDADTVKSVTAGKPEPINAGGK